MAQAAPVSPTDFFVQADTDIQGLTTTSGPIAGPSAVTTNLYPGLYFDPNGNPQFNTDGNGQLLALGNATAAARLTSGQLGAAAGPTYLEPSYSGGLQSFAHSVLGDTLYFSNPSASPTTVSAVDFNIHVGGTRDDTVNGAVTFTVGIGKDQVAIPDYYGFAPDGTICDGTATSNCQIGGFAYGHQFTDQVVDDNITGTIFFLGSNAIVPIYMELAVQAQYGYVDFSHTAIFSFVDVPGDVSFTSASGSFLIGDAAATVPEVDSFILFATGLSTMLLFVRSRPKINGK